MGRTGAGLAFSFHLFSAGRRLAMPANPHTPHVSWIDHEINGLFHKKNRNKNGLFERGGVIMEWAGPTCWRVVLVVYEPV